MSPARVAFRTERVPFGVTVDNLQLAYGRKVVLSIPNLEIEAGSTCCIVGPSGSGKTTFLYAVAGLHSEIGAVASGSIKVGTFQQLSRSGPEVAIPIVFQDYALFPHLTVWKNLSFALEVARAPRQDTARLLEALIEALELGGLEGRRPSELSGGQRQRVALGRALAANPGAVLFDEPLSALDRPLRYRLRSFLRGILRRREATSIYVTHDVDEAVAFADKLVVVHDAQIAQAGPPSEVVRRPKSVAVAEFFQHSNLIPAYVEEIDGGSAIICANGVAKMRAHMGDNLAVGQQVIAVLPFDATRLGANEHPVRFTGRMEEAEPSGLQCLVRVRCNDEWSVRALVGAREALEYRPGENVSVSWTDDDLVVVPARPSPYGEGGTHGH